MRKWTYLVASLLLVGATATFTGCIDTDEPEGISMLRGAKSELVKAQAAVELARVDMVKALVENQNLLNKYQETVNKIKDIERQSAEVDLEINRLNVKLKEYDVELKRLEVERAAATTEAYKAEMNAKIEKHKAEIAGYHAELTKQEAIKADWDNYKKLAAETFKKDMIAAEELTIRAGHSYNQALLDIAAAELLMTGNEAKLLATAKANFIAARTSLNTAWKALRDAQDKVVSAMKGVSGHTKNELYATLKTQQATLAYDEFLLEKAKGLASKELTASTLDKELKLYQDKYAALKFSNDSIDVVIEKIKISANYATTEKAVEKAEEAVTEAEDALALVEDTLAKYEAHKQYNAETGNEEDVKWTLPEYKNEDAKKNVAVTARLNTAAGTGVAGYADGVFSLAELEYTEAAVAADAVNNPAALEIKKVEAWLALIKKATLGLDEDLAWESELPVYETRAANAKTTYTAAVTANKTAMQAYDTWVAAGHKDNVDNTLAKVEAALDAEIVKWNAGDNASRITDAKIKAMGTAIMNYVKALGNLDPAKKSTGKVKLYGSSADVAISTAIAADVDFGKITTIDGASLYSFNVLDGTKTAGNQLTAAMITELKKHDNVDATGRKRLKIWEDASKAAYGTLTYYHDVVTETPRRTEPSADEKAATEEDIAEHNNATSYGALGALLQADMNVVIMKDVIAQADVYKALTTEFKKHSDGLKGQIAANTLAYETRLAEIKAAVVAAKAVVVAAEKAEEAAEDAKEALTIEEEAFKTALEDMIDKVGGADGKGGLIAKLQAAFSNFANDEDTLEEFKKFLADEVAAAELQIVMDKNEIAKTQKDLELFEKGMYTEQYVLTRREAELKNATAEFELANVLYNEALEKLKNVLVQLGGKY